MDGDNSEGADGWWTATGASHHLTSAQLVKHLHCVDISWKKMRKLYIYEMEPQLTYIFTYIFNQWNMCVMCSVWIISRNKLLLYRNCIYTVESRHLITEYLHLHLHCVHCVFRDNMSISQIVSATTRPSHHLTFPGRLEQLHYSEWVHISHLAIAIHTLSNQI